MRSFYSLVPGLQAPASFAWGRVGPLFPFGEIWENVKGAPPGLLFRVRSDKDPGEILDTADHLESCVGLIDSATRWRACFAIAARLVQALRIPPISEACWKGFNFATSMHPAAATSQQRNAVMGEIRAAVDASELPTTGGQRQLAFEREIAGVVMLLIQADNDYEAMGVVPFMQPFMVAVADDAATLNARAASVENTLSAVLLAESAGRLADRIPQWLYAEMPAMVPPRVEGHEKAARAPSRSMLRDDADEDDDE